METGQREKAWVEAWEGKVNGPRGSGSGLAGKGLSQFQDGIRKSADGWFGLESCREDWAGRDNLARMGGVFEAPAKVLLILWGPIQLTAGPDQG